MTQFNDSPSKPNSDLDVYLKPEFKCPMCGKSLDLKQFSFRTDGLYFEILPCTKCDLKTNPIKFILTGEITETNATDILNFSLFVPKYLNIWR